MLTKKQKKWLWVFIAMFAIPEILFLITPLSILSFVNNFSATNITAPIYYIISQQFFVDNPAYLLLAIAIEWLGVVGILITSAKRRKKVFVVISAIFLLWLFIIFGLTNMFMNIR